MFRKAIQKFHNFMVEFGFIYFAGVLMGLVLSQVGNC